MQSPILFVEINKYEYIFIAGEINENGNFRLVENNIIPIEGINDNKITNLEKVNQIIRENIYSIEQKLNFIFKEVILIINNFDCLLINFSGFKNLNGSQLEKDNITYLLNSLKSKISEVEDQRTILHILNSNYLLDKNKIDNLPIGLFGNLYSQELTFFLIKNNDFKNLKNIFNKCNLRIKKIISKHFLEGIRLIDGNTNLESFFAIELSKKNSELIFFENSALRFVQDFKFGTNLILNDISKIIGLDTKSVENVLINSKFSKENITSEYIERKFFKNQNFRKIKKKLILDIANARIQEFAEVIIFKNINLKSFLKKKLPIFLKIDDTYTYDCFEDSFRSSFSNKKNFELSFLKKYKIEELYKCANSLVQYGWKKEAIPVVHEKKSIITRIFNLFFD